jgi:O-antigen ligase
VSDSSPIATYRPSPDARPGSDLGLLFIRLGSALVGVGLLLSLWASPDRMASLPWFLVDLVGVVLVLVWTGPLLPVVRRGLRSEHLVWFFLATAFVSLVVTLFTSRWPVYKLSWLNQVYAALPSIRSLPWTWVQAGLSPNQTGGILALCTAFALAVSVAPGVAKRQRVPAIVLSVAGIAGVFITGSRAALAGLAVAILVLVVARAWRWVWIWGPALLLTALGLLASGAFQRSVTFFVHDETLDTKLVARLDIWTSAANGIQDHFFSGIGLGVFNQVMPVRYPYQTVGLAYPVSQAHNLLLDIALAIGVPGAVGFALLVVGLLVISIKGTKRDTSSRVACLGILASIVVYLVFGITDSISLSIPTSFIVWLWACALSVLSLSGPHEAPVALRDG